jgi:hypothetical protein
MQVAERQEGKGGKSRNTERTEFGAWLRRQDTEDTEVLPTPTPVFCEKRLQATENKGRELRKDEQKSTRGGKQL